MEEQILITYDNGLDISPEFVKKYDLKMIPVHLKVGGDEVLDDGSIKPEEVVDYFYKNKQLIMTSAPTTQEIFRFFTKYAHLGYTIIHFTCSSKLSYSYDNAIAAAENFNKVHVIDSKAYAIGGMPLVAKASQMAKEGKSAKEIIDYCTEMTKRIKMHVIIGKLDFIHSDGRINVAQKMMLSLFGMMPTIDIEDGYFETQKSYRGKLEKVSIKAIDDIMKNIKGIERAHAYVGHTGVPSSIIEECRKEVMRLGDFEEVHTLQCGCSTTTHYGDSGILLCWVEK